jgi:hypothetical protein
LRSAVERSRGIICADGIEGEFSADRIVVVEGVTA